MSGLFLKKQGKLGVVLTGMLTLALLLNACSNNSPNNSSTASPTETNNTQNASNTGAPAPATDKVVTDAMGHEVTIPANPQAVLASYLEDHLVTLGVTPVAQWSVANGIQDYLKEGLDGVPTISYDLPLEAVTSVSPDLIIIGSESQVQNDLYDQYSKIAPTYVLGDAVNNDWREALRTIGGLLNKQEAAEAALAAYETKAVDAKEKLSAAIGTKSAAALWLVAGQFFIVDETRSSGAVLYTDLGLTPPNLVTEIAQADKGTWNPVSLEKLSELTADYIFIVNSDKGQDGDLTENPIWKNLPAVKANQVYEMDSTHSWLYSGYTAGSQIIDDALSNLVK